MSIIHDALKKVQKTLSSKAGEIQAGQPKEQQDPPFVYSTLPVDVKQAEAPVADQKPPVQNKFKSILALLCATAITAGSCWYLYQQFQNNIPQFQRFAKKSFFKLIHKEELPDFKTKSPQDLRSLAQLVINPSSNSTSNAASSAGSVTLNVHGILSKASGNYALINDQVYQEGDTVEGAKILKIDLDSITVNINGTDKTIFVKN